MTITAAPAAVAAPAAAPALAASPGPAAPAVGAPWFAAAAGVAALALAVLPGPVDAVRRLAGLTPPTTTASPTRRSRVPVLGGLVGLMTGVAVGGVAGLLLGGVLGATIALATPVVIRRRARRGDPWDEAAAWDQLGACLRAGLPLDRAVRAVLPVLDPGPAAALTRVADLVALGADPETAWEPALADPATAPLARAARRSARSGAAVADVAASAAADVRAAATDAATARGERAGVLVTGPLGLCFLPAFLALGIVPVVIGLAGPLLEQR